MNKRKAKTWSFINIIYFLLQFRIHRIMRIDGHKFDSLGVFISLYRSVLRASSFLAHSLIHHFEGNPKFKEAADDD